MELCYPQQVLINYHVMNELFYDGFVVQVQVRIIACLPEKTEKEDKKYPIKTLFENHCFFDKV
jgi:hypothetical protein